MLVFGRSEIFVLQAHHLRVAAGIFALATGLAGQVTVPIDSILGPLLPTAAALLAEAPSRATEVAERTLRVMSVLSAFTMAAAVPAVVVAIPFLFSKGFSHGKAPFAVLGLISCFQSVAGPLSTLVLASRNAGSVLRVNIGCLALDAALAIALVPAIGIWGAVAANSSAQVMSISLLTVIAVRRVGVDRAALFRSCLPLMLGLAGAGVALTVISVAHLPTAAALAAGSAAGLLVELLGFRLIPALRVSPADAARVEDALPAVLRPIYRGLTRAFGVVA
jgi:O-antigen/teichoic acid export membrane protein